MRILIAEDEWVAAFTLRSQLQRRGFDVVAIAKNGEEAVNLCCQHRPEAVLMDIRMPQIDGIEATRRIMESCPTCIVILTGTEEWRRGEDAQAAGAMTYLLKPIGTDALVPAIEEARKRFTEGMKDEG